MIDGLKPYPDMKPTGLPWLGDVPAHWEVNTLAALGQLFKGNGGSKADEVSLGIPCVRYGDIYTRHEFIIWTSRAHVTHERAADYTPIQYGDVLFAASGETIEDIGRSAVNLINSPACCGGDVIVFRKKLDLMPSFLGYACDSSAAKEQKVRMGRGFTVFHIYASELKQLRIAIPPPDEQRLIVAFLDHAVRRIRRYIGAKQKLVKLLKEQKQAIIHRAVTRGLDPTVKLKPSGIPWLGDVPEEWEVLPLKRVTARRCDGPFGSGLKSSHYTSDGVRVVRLQNLGQSTFKKSAEPAFISESYYSTLGDHTVLPDDLLIASLGDDRNPCGRACVAPNDIGRAMVKADCFRFRLKRDRADPHFLAAALSATAEESSAILSAGATRQRVNLQSTAERSVALPNLVEQCRIVDHLSKASAMFQPLFEAAEREIALLQEFRTRLIADVVTGKLDVLAAALNLPEITAEEPIDEPTDGEDLDQAIDDPEDEGVAA